LNIESIRDASFSPRVEYGQFDRPGAISSNRKNEDLMPQHAPRLALIDGRWCGADDGATFAVVDPASGKEIARVPDMGVAEAERAIAAAAGAFATWKKRTAKERAAKERADILRRWQDLMLAEAERLAALMTREQGKPLAEARGEVAYAASFLGWFAEEGRRANGLEDHLEMKYVLFGGLTP
jgi:succinate-semialdehyde dehydrogenase / glutarate-semialdehyde dehydrogenase